MRKGLALTKVFEADTRTADWLILTLSFLVFTAVFDIFASPSMSDWDLWTDSKDGRMWATVMPIISITVPAAAQYFLWGKLRLPFGATFTILGLLFGQWVNRYFYLWGWNYYPINFVWAATLVPGAIILDVVLLWSKSFLVTAVVGGLSFGLIFYPGNWVMLAPLHQPVEYHGMAMTIADIQGYHYVRTGTPEYLRFRREAHFENLGRDALSWSVLFFWVILSIYFIWHFFRRWLERYLAQFTSTRYNRHHIGEHHAQFGTRYKESALPKGEKALSREKLIVRSIFLLSVAMAVVGITLLGGTTLGFAMFFSGGILAFEFYLLLSEYK